MSVDLYKYGKICGYPGIIVCIYCWLRLPFEVYKWSDNAHSGCLQILDLMRYPIELYNGGCLTYNGYTHIEVFMYSNYVEPVFPKITDIRGESDGDLEDISWEIIYTRQPIWKILFHQLRRFLDCYSALYKDYDIPVVPVTDERDHCFVILDYDGSRKLVDHNPDYKKQYECMVTIDNKELSLEESEKYELSEEAKRHAEFKAKYEEGLIPSLSDLIFTRVRQQCFSGHYRECVITLHTALECLLAEICRNSKPSLSDTQIRELLRRYSFTNRFTKLLIKIFGQGLDDVSPRSVSDNAYRSLMDDVRYIYSLRNSIVHEGLDIDVDEAWEAVFSGDRICEAVKQVCGLPYHKLCTIGSLM